MPTATGYATNFITFSRASNATVTGSDGYIKWAAHNLLLASEQFDASNWTKTSATVTANSIAAPNSTTTADTVTASGANGTALQTWTAEAVSYTFGVWLKRKTGTGNIQIAADNGTYTTVTITSDWALYTVTQTPAAGSKSAGIRIVTSGDEVYVWGAYLYRSDLGGMVANTSAYPYYNPTTPKNLLGYTESLTTGWTNTNTTDSIVGEVNPNGLTGAVEVTATAGNGTLLSSLSLLASPYTFSIWLKRKTGTGTVEITVDGTTYVTAAVTSTWTRFSTTLTPTAGTKTPGIRIVTNGDAVYTYGAQLSDSASLDTYVPNYFAAPTAAAYYGPRLDYDSSTLAAKGLLVEEQRTNLFLYSEDFANAAWTKSAATISSGSTESPDGTVDASKIVESATLGTHFILQSRTSTASAAHTTTLFVKAAERSIIRLQLDDGSANGAFCTYNLTGTPVLTTSVFGTGSAASASATLIANGWYRCSLSCIPATTGTTVRLVAYLGNNSGVFNYTGDGTSGLNIWGAQIEAGSFATSYIPTTSATVTRSADVAQVSTQAFPYSASEGTLVVAADFIGQSSGVTHIAALSDGLPTNFMTIRRPSTGEANLVVNDGGSSQVNITGQAIVNNVVFKNSAAYKLNDYAFAGNGLLLGTDTSATVPISSVLSLGNIANVLTVSGHIRQITYIPRRLTNAELQSRTT